MQVYRASLQTNCSNDLPDRWRATESAPKLSRTPMLRYTDWTHGLAATSPPCRDRRNPRSQTGWVQRTGNCYRYIARLLRRPPVGQSSYQRIRHILLVAYTILVLGKGACRDRECQ